GRRTPGRWAGLPADHAWLAGSVFRRLARPLARLGRDVVEAEARLLGQRLQLSTQLDGACGAGHQQGPAGPAEGDPYRGAAEPGDDQTTEWQSHRRASFFQLRASGGAGGGGGTTPAGGGGPQPGPARERPGGARAAGAP